MSEQDWTLEEVQAFDRLLEGVYVAGKALGAQQTIQSGQNALRFLTSPGFYQQFPTLEEFMAFMHDDPRVQGALKRST